MSRKTSSGIIFLLWYCHVIRHVALIKRLSLFDEDNFVFSSYLFVRNRGSKLGSFSRRFQARSLIDIISNLHREWINYRHQADVLHAYQILHKLGVPDSHIVTMMYDGIVFVGRIIVNPFVDIANNTENPFPGVIINVPNGPNVYEGALKDYTGESVSAVNFLNILSGNASAMRGIGSGKVIASTAEDDVFVYFADHGSPGLILFPENDFVLADVRNDQNMHTRCQAKAFSLGLTSSLHVLIIALILSRN